MIKKWKIFGYQVEWYDIKTKGKKIARSLLYSWLVQNLICRIIVGYMWLVYLTSKKQFINHEKFLQAANSQMPVVIAFWHNRLMMMPFLARVARKSNPKYKFMSLASHHGDGQFVGRVLTVFHFQNIYGSSQNGRNKKSRGIDMHALRTIVRGLKNGKGLGITPDGPRGPNQKVNGEVIAMAKISGATILPAAYSCSRFMRVNSWDKFKIPLPFSKLAFYCGDLMVIDKGLDKEEEEVMRLKLEQEMNFVQEKSWEFCSKIS